MDDGVAVNGEDGRVPVPDPGDRVILDLAKIGEDNKIKNYIHI